MRPRHAPKGPTQAARIAALTALLIQRERLDTIDRASLCRSYGVSEPELARMIDKEQQRRRARA